MMRTSYMSARIEAPETKHSGRAERCKDDGIDESLSGQLFALGPAHVSARRAPVFDSMAE